MQRDATLSPKQLDFLNKASPLANMISGWVYEKALLFRIPIKCTIFPAIVLADMVVESQWGEHPLAQAFIINGNSKLQANNLTMLEVNDLWQGKEYKFEGKDYKTFSSWMHFATDYSDQIIFDHRLRPLIQEYTIEGQLDILKATKEDPTLFDAKSQAIIEFYELVEFF